MSKFSWIENYKSTISSRTETDLALVKFFLIASIFYFFGDYIGAEDYRNSIEFSQWAPISFFQVFAEKPNWEFVALFKWGMISFGGLSILGFFSRISTIVFSICTLFWAGLENNFGAVSHSSQLIAIALIILTCSRSFRSSSVKSFFKEDGRTPITEGVQLIFLIKFWVVLVYFIAGLQKLRFGDGLAWAWSDNLTISYLTGIRRTFAGELLVSLPPILIKLAALYSLLIEVFAPLALINRFTFMFFSANWLVLHIMISLTFGGHQTFLTQSVVAFAIVLGDYFSFKKREFSIR